jgi:hypothetical protein
VETHSCNGFTDTSQDPSVDVEEVIASHPGFARYSGRNHDNVTAFQSFVNRVCLFPAAWTEGCDLA